ncbi:hypothetical protein IG631_04542 [Alternaria alternata]|nr:hypothetical protein IG631_04542 [Alternaria alternata]
MTMAGVSIRREVAFAVSPRRERVPRLYPSSGRLEEAIWGAPFSVEPSFRHVGKAPVLRTPGLPSPSSCIST